MKWSINQTFYMTCLIIDINKLREMQLEQWKRTH